MTKGAGLRHAREAIPPRPYPALVCAFRRVAVAARARPLLDAARGAAAVKPAASCVHEHANTPTTAAAAATFMMCLCTLLFVAPDWWCAG